MRVVALGGAGAMGRAALEVVATFEAVRELVVADRDPAAADAVARSLPRREGLTTTAATVDVTDPAALRAALAGADAALNTTGPFFRFGVGVAEAAIDAGVNLLDICDDPEPTEAILALDGRARSAGVCVVVGMGASPGVSNLLARLAAERLDVLDDVFTAWGVDAWTQEGWDAERAGILTPDGRASAAVVHWMEQISGEVATVRDGRVVHERPLEPLVLDVPGFGSGTVFTVGHPEPLTLRRTLSPRGRSANVMVIPGALATLLEELRDAIDAGDLTAEQAAEQRAVTAEVPTAAEPRPDGRGLPPFFALARGIRDGRPSTVLATLTSTPRDMAGSTGVPLALGLEQVLDGAGRPGVHPPDAILDAHRLLAGLAPRCDPPASSGAELLHVAEARA